MTKHFYFKTYYSSKKPENTRFHKHIKQNSCSQN